MSAVAQRALRQSPADDRPACLLGPAPPPENARHLTREISALQAAGVDPARLQPLLLERDRLDRRWEYYGTEIVGADTDIKAARSPAPTP